MTDELVTDLWDGLPNLSNKEKYNYIMDIAEAIKEEGAKNFGNGMIHTLNNICTQFNICPECQTELEVSIRDNYEVHNELDEDNIEYDTVLYCPNCGYNTDND